jgi:hypothetical protein
MRLTKAIQCESTTARNVKSHDNIAFDCLDDNIGSQKHSPLPVRWALAHSPEQ